MNPDFHIIEANWDKHRDELLFVRRAVFIDEQEVPASLDLDGQDGQAIQRLARDGKGAPVGTARLLPTGQIGRVAVLKEWRGSGVGSALMRSVLKAAECERHSRLFLHGQMDSIPFYEKLGFKAVGPVFEEAGILHREMILILPKC